MFAGCNLPGLGQLRELADQVIEQPVALGVINGTGYGSTRPDGVHQIPVAALAV